MPARSVPETSSTIRPSAIINVRVPSSKACCMLCVTIRQVIFPSATIRFVSSSTFSAVPGSRAAVCSSRSRSQGGFMVAISSVSACRWPPESNPTG